MWVVFRRTGDESVSTYVKVKVPGKKSIYLKDASEVRGFLVGWQVKKDTDELLVKTPQGLADVKHMIQLGDGVIVTPQVVNPKYCELEDERTNQ